MTHTQIELQNVWDFGSEDYRVGDKQLKVLITCHWYKYVTPFENVIKML